ncbi:hypothetical protein GALMADRAFT_237358 [Galerina marginata CBS 339.88]|uniref:Uncharacterized protein n=1 Tax=Galerina marginata (strain CBS 339.88) TaxID=685588 RepID=A0A067TZK0_GALM3|nr:hypothetical protein GALMADRAFT_237358 [Galerina marginata CBS 339.88]
MDVLAAATTVCSLCNLIVAWIDKLAEKETLLVQISSTVLQIRNILHPFASSTFSGTGEQQLSASIRSVGDLLQRINEDLLVYQIKRTKKVLAFLNPAALVQKLKEDQRQLNHQMVVLIASITTVGYFRDHARDAERMLVDKTQKYGIPQTYNLLDELHAKDARGFWQDYIGAKMEFVNNDLLSARLAMWYNGDSVLTKKTYDRIIMRLDEYNCGGVTPHNLTRALGSMSLKQFVETYARGEIVSESSGKELKDQSGYQLRLPLLVWIDDRPENNSYEVAEARGMGIQVVELPSTAAAKAWVDENEAFLRQNDNASYIRFISDNVRLEGISGSGKYLNASAGQKFLQYLRGRLFRAPVLIYTGDSISSTEYVMTYESAGSTTDPEMCMEYIASLAAAMNDDTKWKGFWVGWH